MAALLPVILIALSGKNNSVRLKGLAGLSTVFGIIAVRINLVLPAYVVPQIPGLDTAYVDSRLVYHYAPSAIEILSSLGIIALVMLLFSLAWELLPIMNGRPLKSSLQLLQDEAYQRSLDEYAQITGLKLQDIVDVAQEFTAHGKKAAVEFYRGAVKHTNGWYNAQALIALNYLIGNPDWQGGLAKPAGGWDYMGKKPGKPYNMAKLHPGKLTAFGVPITREGWQYEESTLFAGYPAKRPWYPFSGNVAQETWPSMADGYPYPIKAVLMSSHTAMYSIPGGVHQLPTLLDPEKVPLFIACDIVIGETSMYADYIFPDITYLERWATGQGPNHIRTAKDELAKD